MIRERNHDAYHADEKRPSGTQCRQCGAVVERGAWHWGRHADTRGWRSDAPATVVVNRSIEPAPGGVSGLCPACERIRAHDAAGVLIIDASVMSQGVEQLHATLNRIVREEGRDHPMERILNIQDLPDGSCLVETTGLHLLRRLGHGLERAFSAHLHTHYLEAELKGTMRLSV